MLANKGEKNPLPVGINSEMGRPRKRKKKRLPGMHYNCMVQAEPKLSPIPPQKNETCRKVRKP